MITVNSQWILTLNLLLKKVYLKEKEYKNSKKRKEKMRLNNRLNKLSTNHLNIPKSTMNILSRV